MRTKETTIFLFNELDDDAKERAREWFRKGSEFDAECTIDNFADMIACLGFDIRQRKVKLMDGTYRYAPSVYYSLSCSQGDGACFEGTWCATDIKLDKLKAEYPTAADVHSIAERMAVVAKQYPDACLSVKHRGHYYHELCTVFDVNSGDVPDDSFDTCEEELVTCSRELMQELFSLLEAEYEYSQSDAVVDDSILANEYEFTADGERA